MVCSLRRVAGLIALAALCDCSAASATRDPGTLVVVYSSDANTLDPVYANNEPAFLFDNFIFDPLVNIGEKYAPIPWLATSWTSTPDHLHWEVNLRRGVTWSDGAPFNARDVVFTWKTMQDPKVADPYAGQFTYIKAVTAEGPYRVRFDLTQPNVLFVSGALNSPILPEHVLGTIAPAQLRTSTFGEHPIGTGPYVLDRWQHDEAITFARNPRWWHGPAKIERIQFRIVINSDARVDAMVDGSADLYAGAGSADYRTLQAIAPHLEYLEAADLYDYFIQINNRLAGLADVNVRRAMLYGWDRAAVVNNLYHGGDLLNDSLTPWALAYWHDANVAHYPYDPAKAARLLDAAGYRPGFDGVRRRGATRLSYTLKNPIGSAAEDEAAVEFQADMKSIGIAIAIQRLDYPTFIEQTNALRYELALMGWGGVNDPDEYTFLDSSQVPPAGNNQTGYANPIVDRDLRAGLRTFDAAKRRAIYDDYQRRVAEDVPVLFAWDAEYRSVWTRRLKIDRGSALSDLYFFWNAFDWRLEG